MSENSTVTLSDGRKVYRIWQSHSITPNRASNFNWKPNGFPVGIEVFHVLGNQYLPLARVTVNNQSEK